MTEITSIRDAEAALQEYIPLSKKMTGKDMTLDRTKALMAAIGNPEKKLKIIHVAGTSGKTSTTYYISALLKEAGLKVGTTVSPHVDSITERVQVDLEPLSEVEFTQTISEFLGIVDSLPLHPTYFELLIAYVYWYFAKIGVDYAVIETGLGGTQDSTNVADNPDKICVITDIGFDHMAVLGDTITAISSQKAGIIHPENTAYMFSQSAEIMDVFNRRTQEVGAKLHILQQHRILPEPLTDIELLPEYQQRNWLLAYAVASTMSKSGKVGTLSKDSLVRSMHIQVPGRMDTVTYDGKTIIMDGAHNQQKMKTFVGSFTNRYPGKKAAVLLSLKEDKQLDEVLDCLKTISDKLIVTSFSILQDRAAKSIAMEDVVSAAQTKGFTDVQAFGSQEEAYMQLLKQDENILIITGSFYLIGQIRANHKELR